MVLDSTHFEQKVSINKEVKIHSSCKMVLHCIVGDVGFIAFVAWALTRE